jgi:hypothetical protein
VIESSKILNRFWSKVERKGPNECWLWKAGRFKRGYGLFYLHRKLQKAHRASFQIHHGEIPPGKCVCHTCDNPLCVNPAHLWIGSVAENNKDRSIKGRSATGDRSGARTHIHLVPRGERAAHAKVTASDVIEIRRRYNEGGVSQKSLGDEFGITQSVVSKIILRENWRHI